jgi:hypothetical protein
MLKSVITGNEKVMLDLTFPKMVISHAMKFSCIYDERRE